MPIKASIFADACLFERLQADIVQGQGQRAQIMIQSDMNARTAEVQDNVQNFDL